MVPGRGEGEEERAGRGGEGAVFGGSYQGWGRGERGSLEHIETEGGVQRQRGTLASASQNTLRTRRSVGSGGQ